MVSLEVLELFTALESNQPEQVDGVKHKISEHFNLIRDPWLLYGMYDYYMVTESQRAVEILVAVKEPHDKYLFNKLGEDLQTSKRLQALTLLGHVVKRQPEWLIKITQHCLLKELIKILTSENEIITIISAVLVINILLTVIPARIAPFLPDIFEGYSRLAAWNVSQKNRFEEIHLFHLQISLYVLFVQLYSMYPCSFIMFLKQKYSKNDNLLVFTHTVKPMIDTMRMHPSFVISSEDVETSALRWKKMQQHDVVMECTKYTLLENGGQYSACCTNNELDNMSSALDVLKSSIGANGDITSINSIKNNELWSPMLLCEGLKEFIPTAKHVPAPYHKPSFFNHNEHSPPEAAIEATPETTPIRDVVYQQMRLPSANSSVVRKLNTFGLESVSRRNSSSPNSQPSSPLKKEGFVFPHEELQSQAIYRRMDRMLMERYQSTDSNKNENNAGSESRYIANQTQPSVNPEVPQTDVEDIIECDQQSNGSPCLTYEGGLHMPVSSSWKGFFNHRRYHSQCTPEKTNNAIGQSTGNSPQREADFSLLNVRRANSCPEIKKTNGNSISSSTSPLHEETEEKNYGDGLSVNGHDSDTLAEKANIDNHVISVQNSSTQTENVLPYEHLLYSVYPAYNDAQNSFHQQNIQKDDSLTIIENYVRTSAIVLKHRHTSTSTNDVELLKHQIMLLTLQLQFERNRREVHAERNRRLLGKSRLSRSLDENNSALKDQVKMLNVELTTITSELNSLRQSSSKQVRDLKDSVTHWQDECLKYQMETKEAEKNYLSLEQLYNGERLKTAEVTKQLSETKVELFDTLSELTIVQAAADMSEKLSDTVTTLQRELVMRGEMQFRQRDIMTQVNNVRYDAVNAMFSQEACKNQLHKLQEELYQKSMLLEASNAHNTNLEMKLRETKSCMLRNKRDMEEMKEQFSKDISEMKEECRILEEQCCIYEENRVEEESKKQFLDQFPQFSFDSVVADYNISIAEQEEEHMLDLAMANIDDSRDNAAAINITPE